MADPSRRLEGEILATIASDGPIPFSRFMELCLYHPRHGYYTRGIGGGGGRDYLTSSGIHPVFGALVARQVDEMWRLLGRPAPFRFVELGPGEGRFARDLLEAAARTPDLAAALRCVLVERSPALRARQKVLLADAPGIPVGWTTLEELERDGPFQGCLFMNEVLDAFPVHRVVRTAMGLREVHVGASDGVLKEILMPLSSARIESFLLETGLRLEEGQEVDLNLEAPAFLARAVGLLSRGYAIVVDYGYEARELYHPARRRGTLRALYRHGVHEEYLLRPGDQDLTAHVDFSALRSAAEVAGARCLGLTTQARFLLALGALEFLGDPEPNADSPGDDEAPAARVRRIREREAIKDLVLPDRMGERFRCLLLGIDGVSPDLTGLREPWAPQATASRGASQEMGR